MSLLSSPHLITYLQVAYSSSYAKAQEEFEQAKSDILSGKYDSDFASQGTWTLPVMQCYVEKIHTGAFPAGGK